MFNKNILLCLVLAFSFSPLVVADTVKLNPDHPERYVVVKGDTLWDISERFLQDPWLWPKVWNINPAIKNPHLIYPGDVIALIFVEGKPMLTVERGRPTVKLSPQKRISKIDTAIPTIPIDAIKQFLEYPRVLTEKQLESAAYIVAGEEGRLISGAENKIYVRGIKHNDLQKFSIYRPGDAYIDPTSKKKEILGYEAIHVADSIVLKHGDPATLLIQSSNHEVLIGDRLLPISKDMDINQFFQPHAPEADVNGLIISVLNGVSRIAQFDIVVLNLGTENNIEPGHVMAIRQKGQEIRDTVNPKMGKTVRLPDEHAGTMMVILPFERVSYALVMEATKDIRVLDSVVNP
ncbi:MAG: LysM peptidoglycan-binding domain-containing protein [Gammaproteobacteria bacterium]